MKKIALRCIPLLLTLVMPGLGCDDDAEGSAGSACSSTLDCDGGHVCVAHGSSSVGACMASCSASVNACGGEATCSGVGTVSVEICQPKPDPEDPPEPEDQPRIPCVSDDECQSLVPGAICAQWRGMRDCTIPCTVERDCDPPGVGGVRIDFFSCQPDEGDETRTACLPDPACWSDLLSCIEFPSDVPQGDFPDLPDDDFPDADGF